MQNPSLATMKSLCYASHFKIITAFCPSLLNPTCTSFLQRQDLTALTVLPFMPETNMDEINVDLGIPSN